VNGRRPSSDRDHDRTSGRARIPGVGEEAKPWSGEPARRETRGSLAAVSTGKIGMWIFLASDAMGFGGLLLAYAMLRVRAAAWPDPEARFDRPLAAALTFALLFSGATMTAVVAMCRSGRWRDARGLLCVTALAGAGFVAGQAVEFEALARSRHVGLTADHAAALFYLITGYHGVHVLVGVGTLAVIAARMQADRTPRASLDSVEVASLYWQFVDLVWIVIFIVLYLLPPARNV
jgi:heme/copper-type cytochrome/quinol oxidase subunit 3